MENAILLAKNQEYVSQKCEKSYFSTKYKFFRDFSDKYSLFLANNIVISINYYNFFFKILFFIKIKNKRTKPDVSLAILQWKRISDY